MFDCWVSDLRTLFCVRLLGQWVAHLVLRLIVGLVARHSVLRLIVGSVAGALCFAFDFWVSGSHTLFCV